MFHGHVDIKEDEKTGPQWTGVENDIQELYSAPNTADQSASLGASTSVGGFTSSRGESDLTLGFQAIQVSELGW